MAVQLPEPTLGLLIIAARNAIRQAIGGRASRFRLTTQQFWAIVGLKIVPGLTPGDLGHWMLLDAPAASRLVAELAKKKLVEITPDRADRRRTRLTLTPRGEALGEQLRAIAAEYHEASVRGMSPEQVEAVRAGLRRVAENLAGFGEATPAPRPRRG